MSSFCIIICISKFTLLTQEPGQQRFLTLEYFDNFNASNDQIKERKTRCTKLGKDCIPMEQLFTKDIEVILYKVEKHHNQNPPTWHCGYPKKWLNEV